MKTILSTLTILLVFGCQSQPTSADDQKIINIAEEVLENFEKGNFKDNLTYFDATMTSQFSPETMAKVWKQIQSQAGVFQSKGITSTGMLKQYRVVYVVAKFEKAPLKFKAVFDNSDKIAGLFFVPLTSE